MIIDIEQQDGVLTVSYCNKAGDVELQKYVIPQEQLFEWEYCDAGGKPFPGIRSWDNKPVKKRKVRHLSKWRIEEFLFTQPASQTENIYALHEPKKFFVDIEVEVHDEWPKPETAKTPVTAITFCTGNRIIGMGTRPLSAEQIKSIKARLVEHLKEEVEYNYIAFNSEYDMLVSFFHKAIHKMPLLTGWNFIGFDWTYLRNRCKRLNVDLRLSSITKKLSGQNEFPMHCLIVDYLEVYKKWDRLIDVKENNTLDFVAKVALGIPKVKYPGTLQELYQNDFESYIFYNAVDTKLVEMIDRKLNTLQTFLLLGNITRVESLKAYSPIYMAEAAMCREFLLRGKVFPRTDKLNRRRESYEGAFVVEPKTGLYEWVTSFDFASLYPSIMRQWNISPESYIRNLQPGEAGDPETEIVCSSGAVFQKGPDSAFRSILTEYYDRRKTTKRAYMEIEDEIEQLKKYIK